ncbi:CD48 antigen isoform X2 [Pagrus major]|uniref:CD48 antigen isoform X2 n=1 Tax=Pagrus major TaxID=143350 RepID=UPI003CC8835F
MRLLVISIIILQVGLVESLKEVSGYLGDNVTLPSGADPSWTLSKIEWSIFPNNTWIATSRNGKKSIERFYRYKGRLSLDTTTGDLTIHNLNRQDTMEYSVDLDNTAGQDSANKIKLTVTERLQKPTIRTAASIPENGGCWVVLQCSSADQGVEFTWQVEPSVATDINTQDRHGSSAVHVAFLNTTRSDVQFTCTSSKNKENNTCSVTPHCSVEPTPPVLPESRCRYGLAVVGGAILGIFLSAVVMYFFGEKIKAVWGFITA